MLDAWQGALDYLYGLANWETRPPGTLQSFELDRIRSVLAALGDPHRAWPAVHVAGTNGKGSTCVLVAAALRAAGYRVGLFTSPHLHTVRERIRVDDCLIAEDEVLAWLDRNRAVLDRHAGLTTFEVLTALAFDRFAAAEIDVGVIEVGLGGRLDTTNVVRPVVSAITPIGLDHTRVLGNTVAAIAADKAGIIRTGVPVVVAPQVGAAGEAIGRAAEAAGSTIVAVGRDVRWTEGEVTVTGQRFDVAVLDRTGERAISLEIALVGAHQQVNAATAVGILATLARRGWAIDDTAIRAGCARARWPGRFEQLGADPTLIVDGAHNPPAAEVLARAVAERHPGARRWLILGVSRDKDLDGILRWLLPGVTGVVATRSEHPRALPAPDLAAAVRAHHVPCDEVPTVAEALDRALGAARADDVVLATGSIFLVADVREAWAARGRIPMPPRDPPPAIRRD
jgi:dihydrofolate synthase / folylpolyglutamate synthase